MAKKLPRRLFVGISIEFLFGFRLRIFPAVAVAAAVVVVVVVVAAAVVGEGGREKSFRFEGWKKKKKVGGGVFC